MSRIISMLAKLSFLVATAAIFALAPAGGASAQDLCPQPGITCPPYSDAYCESQCLILYPENEGIHICHGQCICAC